MLFKDVCWKNFCIRLRRCCFPNLWQLGTRGSKLPSKLPILSQCGLDHRKQWPRSCSNGSGSKRQWILVLWVKSLYWKLEPKTDSHYSHSCRSGLHAVRFHSWADSHFTTSIMAGKRSNLAECRCYHHDVSLASIRYIFLSSGYWFNIAVWLLFTDIPQTMLPLWLHIIPHRVPSLRLQTGLQD